MHKTKGFTLIELVMVIVILGALSAVALPQFVDLRRDANIAVVQSTEGVVRVAASNARLKCKLTTPCDTSNSFTFAVNGTDMAFWRGQLNAGENTNGSIHDWVQTSGLTVVFIPSSFTRWQLPNARDPASCYVQYQEVADLGKEPSITTVTNGC